MAILYDALLSRWLCEYLSSSYPAEARRLGDPALAAFCEDTLKSARARGFHDPEEIRKYAHLAFLFGADFSAALPGASEILADRHYRSAIARLRALEDAAVKHLHKTQTHSEPTQRA